MHLLKVRGLPLFAAGIASLSGCYDVRAPDGYEAVEDVSHNGCPDLSGHYDLTAVRQNPLITDWLDPQKPGMTTLMLDATAGSGTYRLSVQMDIADFLAQAAELRNNNPANYYDWRKLTLALQNNNVIGDKAKHIESVQQLGPLLHMPAQMRIYACNSGWMKVLEKERSLEGEEGRYVRQWDLWLGRDVEGHLLLRTIIYRQKPGWTFWAAGGAGVRLIQEGNHWDKIPQKPGAIAASTLREQDLPEVSPPKRSRDCVKDPNSLLEYNPKLMQQIPDDVMLTTFLPLEGLPTDPCDRLRLKVGFSGGQRGASDDILRLLKADPQVENLTLKETRMGANRQLHFLVEYTLILK